MNKISPEELHCFCIILDRLHGCRVIMAADDETCNVRWDCNSIVTRCIESFVAVWTLPLILSRNLNNSSLARFPILAKHFWRNNPLKADPHDRSISSQCQRINRTIIDRRCTAGDTRVAFSSHLLRSRRASKCPGRRRSVNARASLSRAGHHARAW